MIRIAYLLPEGWETLPSGVFTFVRKVLPAWCDLYDCKKAEVPAPQYRSLREQAARKISKRAKPVTRYNLFAGYMKMLLQKWLQVHKISSSLKGGIVVLNDFGCEVMPVALRLRFPFSSLVAISHTHTSPYEGKNAVIRKAVERYCYASCSRVVFNSEALKRMWESKLGRTMEKARVVHHGINLPRELVVPALFPDKSSGIIDVVCIGLFYRWKGQLALIEVWSEVAAACNRPVRLIFVGDGAYLEKAKERVEELGLEKDIIFCGFQKNAADYFNGADIAIHYPVEPEAFGLVLLEAMARGKPVIAPAHGGATEIVVDGETGYLVETEDQRLKTENLLLGSADISHKEHKEAQRGGYDEAQRTEDRGLRNESEARLSLVEAVCRLAEDADLRRRMGEAGRERVRTEFSVEKMLAGYDKVFKELTTKAQRH